MENFFAKPLNLYDILTANHRFEVAKQNSRRIIFATSKSQNYCLNPEEDNNSKKRKPISQLTTGGHDTPAHYLSVGLCSVISTFPSPRGQDNLLSHKTCYYSSKRFLSSATFRHKMRVPPPPVEERPSRPPSSPRFSTGVKSATTRWTSSGGEFSVMTKE